MNFNPIPPKCALKKKCYFRNTNILNFLLFYCWCNWIFSLMMILRWKHARKYHNVNIRDAEVRCTVCLNRCNSSASRLYRDRTSQWQTSSTPLSLITLCKGFPLYIVKKVVLTNVLLHKYDIHLRTFLEKQEKWISKLYANLFMLQDIR